MVFLNKYLLSSKDFKVMNIIKCNLSTWSHTHTLTHVHSPTHSHMYTPPHTFTPSQLDAPLFITLSQCLVAVTVFAVLMTVSKFRPGSVNFPPLELDYTIILKVSLFHNMYLLSCTHTHTSRSFFVVICFLHTTGATGVSSVCRDDNIQ